MQRLLQPLLRPVQEIALLLMVKYRQMEVDTVSPILLYSDRALPMIRHQQEMTVTVAVVMYLTINTIKAILQGIKTADEQLMLLLISMLLYHLR